MEIDPVQPSSYPRRILLAVIGLSPQVVTETLYALTQAQMPAFIPTEVHLIATQEGAERARLTLLSHDPGWFHRFCREYRITGVTFDESHIHVLTGAGQSPLKDIRTEQDNELVADSLSEMVRALTSDEDTALHVSIAGGRKTMGYYAGYALSLYGRAQDRLSHVLVSAPFESNQEFFYPTPHSRVIYTHPPESRPIDTREAKVSLALIPFVRLREEIPRRLLAGRARFSETVAAAQRSADPPSLRIDTRDRVIQAGDETISLSLAELAFYSWMARRKLDGKQPVRWTDPGIAEELLSEYRLLGGEMSAEYERACEALKDGMTEEYFEQRKSRSNGALKDALGDVAARAYLIAGEGSRSKTRFGLRLAAEAVRFGALAAETSHPASC